jgi:uncharacterized repeat protein (TIGR01451 family)
MPAHVRRALVYLVVALIAGSVLHSAGYGTVGAAPVRFTLTKTAVLASDADGDGQAEPGDTLRYTIRLTNGAHDTVPGVTLVDQLDPQTTLLAGSLGTTPLAFDGAVTIAGSEPITVALEARDFDGDPLTLSIISPPSLGALGPLNGASVTYSPTGELAAEDSFTFRATDDDGNSDTATVRLSPGTPPDPQAPLTGNEPTQTRLESSLLELDIGAVPGGKSLTVTFDATIGGAQRIGASWIVNQARVDSASFTGLLSDDPSQPGAADPTVTILIRRLYFPAIQTVDVRRPDLVVEQLEVDRDGVRLIVRNRGTGTVVDPFWVDVYLGPRRAPTAVNEPWPDLGDSGLTWSVSGPALPLEAGDALVLSIGDALYDVARSRFSGTIAPGTPVYAQADSANRLTNHGGVLEGHEQLGLEYNNIAGPTLAP